MWVRNEAHPAKAKRGAQATGTQDQRPTAHSWLQRGTFIGLPFDVPTEQTCCGGVAAKRGGSEQTTVITVKLGGDNAVDTSAQGKASWFCPSERSSEKPV